MTSLQEGRLTFHFPSDGAMIGRNLTPLHRRTTIAT